MNKPRKISHKEQASIWIYRDARNAPMDFIVAPNLSALSDVTRFGRINARENPDALPMFRVLPNRDINAVLVKHWGRIDLANSFSRRIFEFPSFRRIAIILPDGLQKTGVPFLDWLGVERVTN